jgi:hypothetical protein
LDKYSFYLKLSYSNLTDILPSFAVMPLEYQIWVSSLVILYIGEGIPNSQPRGKRMSSSALKVFGETANYLPPLPALRDYIKMYQLDAKKALSQNYLMDLNLTKKVLSLTK